MNLLQVYALIAMTCSAIGYAHLMQDKKYPPLINVVTSFIVGIFWPAAIAYGVYKLNIDRGHHV